MTRLTRGFVIIVWGGLGFVGSVVQIWSARTLDAARNNGHGYGAFVADVNGDHKSDLIQIGIGTYVAQVLGSIIGGTFP